MAEENVLTKEFLFSGLVEEDEIGEEINLPEEPSGSLAPVSTQEAVSRDINAELSQMRARGIDPKTVYKQEQGILGKQDVFSYETEKGFSPKVRKFIRENYGPAEMQYDPDGSMLGNLWTRVFGSSPTKEEQAEIQQATILVERGSSSADSGYKRAMQEIIKGAPSAGEIRGDIPKGVDLPPYLQEYAKRAEK